MTKPTVELGDIVRLRHPYMPHEGREQEGPFPFGIVAEILTVLHDGRPRNVSLYVYDPDRRELLLGRNGIPAYVDFHTTEIDLYKRATEHGYTPIIS